MNIGVGEWVSGAGWVNDLGPGQNGDWVIVVYTSNELPVGERTVYRYRVICVS